MFLHPGKILIVSDDGMRSREIADCLRHQGCRVVFADNGASGLLAIHEEVPAVVLIQADMPIMDGFQTLRVIRADPLVSHLPVIMLMNRNEPDCLARAGEVGADLCLAHGAHPEEVWFLVRRALPLSRAADVSAQSGSSILGRLSA